MAFGSLKIKLRPLRLAFLVQPTHENDISIAIETSSFLWGGAFNPIVPLFRRLPKSWKPETGHAVTAESVVEGYLDAFDPDFVVKVGSLESADLKFGDRELVKCSEILESVHEDGTPAYGIGLLEVLRHFADEELKFIRHQPLQITLPKIGSTNRLFLASAFGHLSGHPEKLFTHNFGKLPGLVQRDCSVENYWEFLSPDNLFIRRIATLDIRPLRQWHRRGDCIFFMDAGSALDAVDYWNLRALGWNVVPVCRQAAGNADLLKFAADFVEENSFAFRGNPDLYNHTTLLRSRTVSMAEMEQFGRSLKQFLTVSKHQHEWKITYQPWYPRIWDEWAREKDGADLCELEVLEEEHEIADHDKHVAFRSLMPEFASRFGGHGKARCANETELRVRSREFLPAEVVPQGGWRLARAAGAFDCTEWRCAKTGLVHFPRHKNWCERLELAPSESVFAEWLRTCGWEPELSDKGHVGKQMLKQLGGEFGVDLLAKEGVIELLGRLAQGRTMHDNALRGAVAEIANKQKFKRPNSERIAEWLVNYRVIQAGLELQCPKCRQHSWYSLKDADYKLHCPKCLEEFSLPVNLKEISWAYRTIGPFSLPQQAYGVYSVLLALHFFTRQLDGATTPMLSFTAKKGASSIEADLGLFFQASKFKVTRTELVFAECKTFNEFEQKDAARMLLLGAEFPGAVLVFATLRKSLTEKEKRLLRKVANRGRRYWKAESPYNPVLILTGNELLADGNPRRIWEELGGVHAAHSRSWGDRRELVALADDTQQIYLDMKPWYQWLDERMKKRQRRLKANPASQAAPLANSGDERTISVSFPVGMRQVPRYTGSNRV